MRGTMIGIFSSLNYRKYTSKKDNTEKSYYEIFLTNPEATNNFNQSISLMCPGELSERLVQTWTQYKGKLVILEGLFTSYLGNLRFEVKNIKLSIDK